MNLLRVCEGVKAFSACIGDRRAESLFFHFFLSSSFGFEHMRIGRGCNFRSVEHSFAHGEIRPQAIILCHRHN